MPSGGDVLLCAFFAGGDQKVGVDSGIFVRIVCNAGVGIAFDVVDVGLV